VDRSDSRGDNCPVRSPGSSRWRLGKTLRAAYAIGLLTHDTFVHRIDDLYGPTRIDPGQLVGDLTFRTPVRARDHTRALLGSIWRWWGQKEDEREQLPLVGLDWTGATSEILVGRSSSCDLVLHDSNVSRRHAQLFFREGRWIILDLDSTNGTYINGDRVQRSELLPGDLLALGTEQLQVD
jgi:hypothetical protein